MNNKKSKSRAARQSHPPYKISGDSLVGENRRRELEQAYQTNKAAKLPPYHMVSLRSWKEVVWILQQHNWISSGVGSQRIDLRHVNLSQVDLSLANFRGADLRGANLSGADLFNAILSQADLSDANLQHANLRETDFTDARMSNCDLRHVNLPQTHLNTIVLQGANLCEIDWQGCHLSGCDLRDVNLRGANLNGANLSRINLSGADLSQIKLQNATLTEVNLSHAKLVNADFSYCSMNNVDLRAVTLQTCRFTGVKIHSLANEPRNWPHLSDTESAILRQEASDPATPPERLEILATSWPGCAMRTNIARNPNTPVGSLLLLAPSLPAAFLANPLLPLMFLEDPMWLSGKAASDILAAINNCPDRERLKSRHSSLIVFIERCARP